jgi:hypothetical protein
MYTWAKGCQRRGWPARDVTRFHLSILLSLHDERSYHTQAQPQDQEWCRQTVCYDVVPDRDRVHRRHSRRLLKEHGSYKDEIVQLQLKHDKFVAEGAEEWDIKNAVRHTVYYRGEPGLTDDGKARMTDESRRMVEDVDERLGASVQDLRDLIVRSLTFAYSSKTEYFTLLRFVRRRSRSWWGARSCSQRTTS